MWRMRLRIVWDKVKGQGLDGVGGWEAEKEGFSLLELSSKDRGSAQSAEDQMELFYHH
jgi:hypothetical protein